MLAPDSHWIVIGLPLAPLPCAVKAVVMVPQRWTVDPALMVPPQLLPLLKKLAGLALAQLEPSPEPPPDWETYTSPAARAEPQNTTARSAKAQI